MILPLLHSGIRNLNADFPVDDRVKFVAGLAIGDHILTAAVLDYLKTLREVLEI